MKTAICILSPKPGLGKRPLTGTGFVAFLEVGPVIFSATRARVVEPGFPFRR